MVLDKKVSAICIGHNSHIGVPLDFILGGDIKNNIQAVYILSGSCCAHPVRRLGGGRLRQGGRSAEPAED